MLRTARRDRQGVRRLGQIERGDGREVAVGGQGVNGLRDKLAAAWSWTREGGGASCVSVQASLAVGMQATRKNSCILRKKTG